MTRWLVRSLDDMTEREQRFSHALALCVGLYLVLYLILSPWYVEDAAISFSYARHVTEGYGFVAYPGGERVEGFSNPSWTLLLVLWDLVGVTPWVAAKLMGALFGAITICLVGDVLWRTADADAPVEALALGPLCLAVCPQFLIWNASGLENSLVNLLMAWGLWAALLRDRSAWHAVALGLLAMTRPEAPLFCAIIAGIGLLHRLRHGTLSEAIRWLVPAGVVALTPWIAWEIWSQSYFGWWLPNTYYAKLSHDETTNNLTWGGHGWRYLRNALFEGGWLVCLPALAMAQTGFGRAAKVLLTAAALCVAAALINRSDTLSEWVPAVVQADATATAQIALIAVIAVLLPLASWRRPGWSLRAGCWWMVVATSVFTVYTNGDWMNGYRWLALASVPLALLLSHTVVFLRSCPSPTWAARSARVVAALPLAFGLVQYGDYLDEVETTPFDVKKRVDYMQHVQDRLHLDHVTSVEIDFGAHMWWSGDTLIDLAGLNDVAVAHHAWEPAFVSEYVYEEGNPEFLHSHGGWATKTGARKLPAFQNYVEIPGYPVGRRKFHVGNHIRRDLLFKPRVRAPTRQSARFRSGIHLSSWKVDAPVHTAGGPLFVEVSWQRQGTKTSDFRPILFLARGETLLTWELPPAYDWVPTSRWKRDEHAIGRHELTLPSDLPTGRYDLGFLVIDDDGIVKATPAHPAPRLGDGEARWPRAIRVVERERAATRTQELIQQATEEIAQDRCYAAERLHQSALHVLPEVATASADDTDLNAEIGRCWMRRVQTQARPDAQEALVKALRRGGDDERVRQQAAALADEWQREGERLLEEGDVDGAYEAWRDALVADPTRSHLRRRTEALRDQRLGLTTR